MSQRDGKRRHSSLSTDDEDALRRKAARQYHAARSQEMIEDERQVLAWLDQESGELPPEVYDIVDDEFDVSSRYSRNAYSGRRSKGGPEASHGTVHVSAPDSMDASFSEVDIQSEDDFDFHREGAYVGASGRRSSSSAESPALDPYGEGKDTKKELKRLQKKAKKASRKAQGKYHPVRRTIKTVLVILVLLIAGWLGYLNHSMQLHDAELNEALTGVSTPFKPYYVLICGSDQREDEASRADTIMLTRIDPVNDAVTIISIPRDTRVYLGEEYGYSKINAAHAYGGPAMMVRAVSEFSGVAIAHYFEVDFEGFSGLVDAVGGVTVDVPPDTMVDDIVVPEGIQTLNGEQALVFVRCRKTYALGDFQRAANQRAFMSALLTAVKEAPVWRYPLIVTAGCKAVSTDRNVFGMMMMALEMHGVVSDNFMTALVPCYTDTIDGVSYVIADDEAWAEMMNRVNAGMPPEG